MKSQYNISSSLVHTCLIPHSNPHSVLTNTFTRVTILKTVKWSLSSSIFLFRNSIPKQDQHRQSPTPMQCIPYLSCDPSITTESLSFLFPIFTENRSTKNHFCYFHFLCGASYDRCHSLQNSHAKHKIHLKFWFHAIYSPNSPALSIHTLSIIAGSFDFCFLFT